jgi:hypothetical protein
LATTGLGLITRSTGIGYSDRLGWGRLGYSDRLWMLGLLRRVRRLRCGLSGLGRQ